MKKIKTKKLDFKKQTVLELSKKQLNFIYGGNIKVFNTTTTTFTQTGPATLVSYNCQPLEDIL